MKRQSAFFLKAFEVLVWIAYNTKKEKLTEAMEVADKSYFHGEQNEEAVGKKRR